ncbi:MAG: response regulator transcription factor [Abditibacteriales bacterium]|nr:response regulator transcription factor [Abditibacteriales bacterium]MDW8366651.1 response regulator transcription factor [Abditibacteriales bacterium]
MSQRILIIEDEKPIADAVAYSLKREGFTVTVATDGESGLSLARTEKPDLIILDLMLPGMDGLAVCRAVRREARTPIIMLTAKAEETDKVVGLELGADDYVTKPFSVRELIARVKAVLRRAADTAAADEEELVSSNLVINLAEHTVTLDGKPVSLSPKEFDLLTTFLRHRGRVLSRDVLLEQVWGEDTYIDTHTVDVHIRWLREKIEVNPSKPERIVTVRGVGYKFVG